MEQWGYEDYLDPKTHRKMRRDTPLRSVAETVSPLSPIILPAVGITVVKVLGGSWLAASGVGLVAFVAWIPVAKMLGLPWAPQIGMSV